MPLSESNSSRRLTSDPPCREADALAVYDHGPVQLGQDLYGLLHLGVCHRPLLGPVPLEGVYDELLDKNEDMHDHDDNEELHPS